MEFLFFFIGLILGIVLMSFIKKENKIYGVIDIDHSNEMCRFHITSEELSNRRNTKAVFKINHEGVIPQENDSRE